MIEDGSVLIRDGVIVAIGSSRRIENLSEARQALEIPVHGKVVMPAFVDAGLNLSINRNHGATNRKKASDFYEEALAIFRSCLQHGTLWAEVKAHAYDGDYESVIPALRQVTKIGHNPLSIRRTWRLDSAPSPDEDVMNRAQKTLAYLVRRKLIDFVEVWAADFQLETCLSFLKTAQALGVGIKAEWSGASLASLEYFPPEVIPKSLRLPLPVDAEAHARLVRLPSVLVFSPGEEFVATAARSSGLRSLLDAGAALALSSGYDLRQATSVSMQMAVALAVIRLQLTTEEAICAGTVNAAWGLGIGHRTGTLEVGKQADVMVLSVSDYRELARQFGINHVAMIMRQGNLVLNRTNWRPGVP
jgi:imidazolonepropionase